MSGSGRRWYDSPMGDLLTAHAADQPDKTAVIDDRTGGDLRRTTYAELVDRANQLVHVLHEHGVRPGDKVVWCGQNSTGIVEFVNASRKLGSTSVPLNYRLSDEEAAYVTDHCDATTVWGEIVHAVIVKREGADLDENGVKAFAREHLASYKIPRSISWLDELPRTGSGKILKRELRQPIWAGRTSNV